MSAAEELGRGARENEEKKEASDHGMALDKEEIPDGARQDGHEGPAVTSQKHDE